MKNIIKKSTALIVTLALVFSIVACGQEQMIDIEVTELVYGTVELDESYVVSVENDITYLSVPEEVVTEMKNEIIDEVNESIDAYVLDGVVNSIEYGDDFKTIDVDFADAEDGLAVLEIYFTTIGLPVMYQTLAGYPAYEYESVITISLNGEFLEEVNLTEIMDFYTQMKETVGNVDFNSLLQ